MDIHGDQLIDEVMVSIVKAPHTYTKENIVEINCHGGFVITEKLLETVLKYGNKTAKIGEFTRKSLS